MRELAEGVARRAARSEPLEATRAAAIPDLKASLATEAAWAAVPDHVAEAEVAA